MEQDLNEKIAKEYNNRYGHMYHLCGSCLEPMCGILKPTVRDSRTAREICLPCEVIEQERVA